MATILIIDDEPEVLSTLEGFLSRRGYHVRTVGDGEAGLRVIDESEVDLVVTDINLPGMDGIELLLALAERANRVPVVAISGGGYFDKGLLLDSAAGLGAVSTFAKPFALSDLELAIRDTLRR